MLPKLEQILDEITDNYQQGLEKRHAANPRQGTVLCLGEQ